jgi:hypothetical protein
VVEGGLIHASNVPCCMFVYAKPRRPCRAALTARGLELVSAQHDNDTHCEQHRAPSGILVRAHHNTAWRLDLAAVRRLL